MKRISSPPPLAPITESSPIRKKIKPTTIEPNELIIDKTENIFLIYEMPEITIDDTKPDIEELERNIQKPEPTIEEPEPIIEGPEPTTEEQKQTLEEPTLVTSTTDNPLLEILKRIEKKVDNLTKDVVKIKKQLFMEDQNPFEDFSFAENFPIKSETDLAILEKKIEDKQFCSLLISLLRKNIPRSENRFTVYLKNIIDPNLLINYNWEGRHDKMALQRYKLFNKCLIEATDFNIDKYQSLMRESIRITHRLVYVKKSQLKKKNSL